MSDLRSQSIAALILFTVCDNALVPPMDFNKEAPIHEQEGKNEELQAISFILNCVFEGSPVTQSDRYCFLLFWFLN